MRQNNSLKKRYARVNQFMSGLQNILSITTVMTFVITSDEKNSKRSRHVRIKSPNIASREQTMFDGAVDFVETVKRPRGFSIVDRHPSGRTMRRYTSFECRKRTTFQNLVDDLHNVPFAIILVVVLTSLTVLPLLSNVINVSKHKTGQRWDWFLDIAHMSLLISLSVSPYAYLLTVKSIKTKFDLTMFICRQYVLRKRMKWYNKLFRREND